MDRILWLTDGTRNLRSYVRKVFKSLTRLWTYTFKKESNFRGDVNELLGPEVILGVSEQLDERHKRTPWMGTMDNKPFEENFGHDLLETITLNLREQVQEQRAEPMSMGVGITEMEDHCAQEVVLT